MKINAEEAEIYYQVVLVELIKWKVQQDYLAKS